MLITRYGDVRDVLKDRALSKDPRKLPVDDPLRVNLTAADGTMRQPTLLFLDPPDHTRLRALVNKAFTPQRVKRLEPHVAAIAQELVGAAAGQTVFDVIDGLARPLPVRVIGEMLGIEVGQVPAFAEWCDAMSHELDPAITPELARRAGAAKTAFNDYLRGAMAARRGAPGDDLVTALLEVAEEHDRLSESELTSMCRLLLLAGNITTTHMIGNGVLALLDHPDQLELLRGDLGLLDSAVEEMLRFDTSVTGVGRNVVGQPTEVAGALLSPGTRLHVSLAGAHRDPDVFPEPERFLIARAPNLHLAFGAGMHACLGASLARLELKAAVRALLERFPRLRLAGPRADLAWQRIAYFRALERLPVAVD